MFKGQDAKAIKAVLGNIPGSTNQERILRLMGSTGHISKEKLEEMAKEDGGRGLRARAILSLREQTQKKKIL